jgi:hypothetical protein
LADVGRLGFDSLAFTPDGALLAVTGRTIPPSDEFPSLGGFVVLSRDGQLIHAEKAEIGQWWLQWANRQLVGVFRDNTKRPPETRVILMAYPVHNGQAKPRNPGLPQDPHTAAWAWSGCTAAPAGTELLCGHEQGWLRLNAGGAPAHTFTSVPGRPLAWIRVTR